jgi:hypothetical protein
MAAEELLKQLVMDWDDIHDTSEALAFTLLKIDNGKWFHWEDGELLRVVYPATPEKEPTDNWDRNRRRYKANLRRFKEENLDYLSSYTGGFSFSAGFLDAVGDQFLNDKRRCVLENLPDDVNDDWLYLIQLFWRKLEDFVRQEEKRHPFHVANARRILANLARLPVFARINPPPVEIPGLREAARSLFADMFRKEQG